MRICVILNSDSSFEVNDKNLLKNHFDVVELASLRIDRGSKGDKGQNGFLNYRRELERKIKDADIVYSWFAGWHTYFAHKVCSKYHKKMVVVAGGYDVARLPEINHGAWCNIKERFPARYVLKNADLVLSVSKSNQNELLEKVKPKANILVYNGVDPKHFYPDASTIKSRQVVSLGLLTRSNLVRKGIQNALVAGSYCQDVPFIIAGKDVDGTLNHLRSMATPNVHLPGYLSNDELLRLYQRSQFYIQLSAHESFGISVVEAMLCECVPIVTDRYALPEVVGDSGIVVPYNDVMRVKDAIMDTGPEEIVRLGKNARKRALDNFTLDIRERKLIKILEEMNKK